MTVSRSQPMTEQDDVVKLLRAGFFMRFEAADEIDRLRAELASARKALEEADLTLCALGCDSDGHTRSLIHAILNPEHALGQPK